MAENEVLDVGNRRYFKRWRAALADANCSALATAELLSQDFEQVLRSKLQRKPFYLVLRACGSSREALTEVIQSFKGRELSKVIEQAYVLTRSKDARVVGEKMASLLIDRLIDRACNRSLKELGAGPRQTAIERAVEAKMLAFKPEITSLLSAALHNEPIRGPRRQARQRESIKTLLATSLMSTAS